MTTKQIDAVKSLMHGTRKLSDFYQSQSTRLKSIYNTDLFIRSWQPMDVQAAGFAESCKAVISLNLDNSEVIEILEAIKAREEAAKMKDAENKQKKIDAEIAIHTEAQAIEADAFFNNEVLAAKDLRGVEKSQALAQSFNALLTRIGHGEIKSNFWRVLVIVKKRID